MGRQQHVRAIEQFRADLRLVLEAVDRGSRDLSGLEGGGECRVVHDASTPRVDQDGAGLHARDLRRADQVVGGRAVGYLHDHEVGQDRNNFV